MTVETSFQPPLVTFRNDFDVELEQYAGGDDMICWAARVSTLGAGSLHTDESSGLIKFLMENRHGCYDSETEVLTDEGWKFWPDVSGYEQFLTLNINTNEIEYQSPQRLIRKPYRGPMVQVKMTGIDALVTPDHNMLAAARTHRGWEYDLTPAREFLDRSHRIRLGGGEWYGDIHCPDSAALLGFIAADGYVSGSTIEFHLRKERKIEFLYSLGFEISNTRQDIYRVLGLSEDVRMWAKATYAETGDRCLPKELLMRGDQETLQALLDGYLMGDGHVSALGKITASSVSVVLVDDLQELAVKCGGSMVEQKMLLDRSSSYGDRPLYRVCFYNERNSEPRIGWTPEDRAHQVQIVDYDGEIHCVTVPNGTLYVRRNGKPMWCGNSPFEHGLLTFRISAPIFVWREFMRHRIGFSYNEESGRYKVLEPTFYLPTQPRPLQQVGKAGHYTFEPGTERQRTITMQQLQKSYRQAWASYVEMLEAGVAKEVSRMCLPVATYSTAYVTCNPRSIMSFLSLRTKDDKSKFPSYPQWEIAQVAKQMEAIFADKFPTTWHAFNVAGRVSP